MYRSLDEAAFDVRHILPLGLAGTDDPAVLQYARDEGRILLTRNYRDFAPLVQRWSSAEVGFPGVLFVPTSIPQADVGGHVRALKAWMKGVHRVENTYGWLRQVPADPPDSR